MKRIDPSSSDIVAHPLISGGMARSRSIYRTNDDFTNSFRAPGFETNPLPDVSEILCGFDAIYQFEISALSDVLPSRAKMFSVEVPYDSSIIEDDLMTAINSALYQPTFSDYATDHYYRYENESFLVRLHSPRVRILPETDTTVQITWSTALILKEVETIESFTDRRGMIPPDDPSGLPPGARGRRGVDEGWGPEELVRRETNLATGTAELSTTYTVGHDAERYMIQAYINGEESSTELLSTNSLFTTLLDYEPLGMYETIEYGIRQKLFSHFYTNTITGLSAALTPKISIAGNLLEGQHLEGVSTFDVVHKVMEGNMPFSKLLCLCVSLNTHGDPDMVQPFVGGKNFAFAISNDAIRSVVASRWGELDRSFIATIDDIEYNLSDGENTYSGIGSAQMRTTFIDLTEIGLSVGPDEEYVDALRLVGNYSFQLIKFILEDGSELRPDELEGDFGTPQTSPYSLYFFLFSPDPEPDATSTAKEFFTEMLGELLTPIYYPLTNSGVFLDKYSGSTHSAAGLIYVKAGADY